MVFKNLVKAILNHRADPSNLMSLHAVSALKGDIANDLIEAYRLSEPLVSANPALFWSSDSFLDFLIRVVEGPDSKSTRGAVSETCGDIPRPTVAALTQQLEKCQKDYEQKEMEYLELEKKYRACWSEASRRHDENDTVPCCKKRYEECRDRCKEVEEKEKCLNEQRKGMEKERREMEEEKKRTACEIEELKRNFEKGREEKKKLGKKLEECLETSEQEKTETEKWKTLARNAEEALQTSENALSAWQEKYRSLEASEPMQLEANHTETMELESLKNIVKEKDETIKQLLGRVSQAELQYQQFMSQTPSHITFNYNTDVSGYKYISDIMDKIRQRMPQESQNIIPQLEAIGEQLKRQEQLEQDYLKLEQEVEIMNTNTLAKLYSEPFQEAGDKVEGCAQKYPKIMRYLNEMIAFGEADTWEEDVVKKLREQDEALSRYIQGLSEISELMYHIELNSFNFAKAIREKLKMCEKENLEDRELFTYINSKHPRWVDNDGSWSHEFIKQDRVVTDLLSTHNLKSVLELRERFNQLQDTNKEFISFIQTHQNSFNTRLENLKWSQDFLTAVEDLINFKKEIFNHLQDVQIKDHRTWLNENAGIYKVLVENNINSASLLIAKMQEFNKINAIFFSHSVNVQTIDRVLQEREDFLNYYKSWCPAFGLLEDTGIEKFAEKINSIHAYYSQWLNILELDSSTPMEKFGDALSELQAGRSKQASTWKRSISAELSSKKAKTDDPDDLEECKKQLDQQLERVRILKDKLDEKSGEVKILKDRLAVHTSENILAPNTLKTFFYFLFIRYFKLLRSHLTEDFTKIRDYQETLNLKRDLLRKVPGFIRNAKRGRKNSDLLDILMKYVQYDLEFEFSSDLGESLPKTETAFLEKCLEDTTARIQAMVNA